ncbi:RNA polymerase sigma factor [Ktedonobacter robiniae]|uniref:RNA polymerase subunit sigma n=2 Tax=Ktedonobacter TaxID=363276 RepID=A0ABQ3V3B8_9CHLR|nr:sigma-70 family RNA polymerase sigma factor [Ktedonobacter robiniae]GHO59669.1 RNA polymerase subunit sigma [Ktedonobacter robiniae]
MKQLSITSAQVTDAALYQRYAPVIFAYLLRQVPSREDAEDLLVDIFLATMEKSALASMDEQRVAAWIWTVARNKVVDYRRRSKYRASIELAKVEDVLYESEEQAPERMALKHEERQTLHTLLQELPELQRQIVHLRFGHDLTCGQIATVIDKSEAAVRMTLHRTLKLLRTLYTRNEKGGTL